MIILYHLPFLSSFNRENLQELIDRLIQCFVMFFFQLIRSYTIIFEEGRYCVDVNERKLSLC